MQLPENYQNLSALAKSSGKLLRHWTNAKVGQKVIAEFTTQHPEIKSPLIVIKGRGKVQGTYAHPELAARFAQWCNPTFVEHVVAQNTLLAERIESYVLGRKSAIDAQVSMLTLPSEIKAVKASYLKQHQEIWASGGIAFGGLNDCKITPDVFTLEGLSKGQIDYAKSPVNENLYGCGDHVRYWVKDCKPFAITSEPYNVADADYLRLKAECEKLGLKVTLLGQSEWNMNCCIWIEIRR